MNQISLSPAPFPLPADNSEKPPQISAELLRTLSAGILTFFLLACCTWGQLGLQDLTRVHRPYTIFYLIPVAIGAALLGARGGLLAALVAVILARVYLFTDHKQGLALVSFPSLAETIEFAALLIGTSAIALITGYLRSTLGRLNKSNIGLQEVNARLIESEEQRRTFSRDVLLAVTGGKLRLMEPDELSLDELAEGPPWFSQSLREPQDATALRHSLAKIAGKVGMTPDRISDLCTAATEAATNAIKHGNGGEVTVWASEDGVTVQIQDHGAGIAPTHLARATLEQGFSTRISLGMGFHLMLQTTDHLALCTQTDGTTLLLQVSTQPRPTPQDSLLARYSSVL